MMKFNRLNISLLFAVILTIGCGSTKTNSKDSESKAVTESKRSEVVIAKLYDYRVVAEYPHSSKSYTQGLQYVDGVMWEGTGREGSSHLQTIDLKTGKVNILASLPSSEFGEGITHYKGRIYQLTWESHKAYLYDNKGNFIKNITYRGEGWGITTDGEHLYMSDGSSTIRRINPDTFATEESICVTLNGTPLDLLNELEWVDGHIWANVYLTDAIVEIDPRTGVVIGFIDLPELRGRLKNNPEAEALNGVAYNATTGNFYVAGKDWNRIFEIEIIK
ncbi:MAG: glutaminyl-peptide cyclotransferase [Alistipes sp.]|nr:glutaminyl-peptide cyclotransferase [Alistipes sp.]